MEQLGIHEYFRILVPGLYCMGLLKIYCPSVLPGDMGALLIIAAFIGLVVTPLTDRLAKGAFHHEVIRRRFYERFVERFARAHGIAVERPRDRRGRVQTFSGYIPLGDSPEVRAILEAYKIFARQGWGREQELHRVRTEKSFGILYMTLGLVSVVALVVGAVCVLRGFPLGPGVFGSLRTDAGGLGVVSVIALLEARARFRMSLENELLALEAHFGVIHGYYEEMLRATGLQHSPEGRRCGQA